MYRPSKRYFTSYGFINLGGSGGYRWYWVKKRDDLDGKYPDGHLSWVEDGDRIYYRCPGCKKVTESYCRRDGNSDSVINGRELDTMQCEACYGCLHHHWMTFEDAVTRKTAGAIRLRPKKCPFCKNSTPSFWDGRETQIYLIAPFSVDLMTCPSCNRKWRIDSLKEKLYG